MAHCFGFFLQCWRPIACLPPFSLLIIPGSSSPSSASSPPRFRLSFIPLSDRLELPRVRYPSVPVLLSSVLHTGSVKSAVWRRLKVLCKRTLSLSSMYLYSWARSAEAALVLCSSSGKVLSSSHHWLTLVVSYTWLLGALVYMRLMLLYLLAWMCETGRYRQLAPLWATPLPSRSAADTLTPPRGGSLSAVSVQRGCACNSLWFHIKSH